MKTVIKLSGIIALIMIIGFSFISCKGADDGGMGGESNWNGPGWNGPGNNPGGPSGIPGDNVFVDSLYLNQWSEGYITSETDEAWYLFDVNAGSTYRIWWNDSYDGDGTYTLDVVASAQYINGDYIFDSEDNGWSSPQSFTASRTGTVYVKVRPYSSGNTGDYGIVYSTSSTRPGSTSSGNTGGWTIPSNTTALTANVWANGNITSSTGEVWYSFTVNAWTTYRIWWNDSYQGDGTKTLDVAVSAQYANGDYIFSNIDNGWNTAQSFTASQTSTAAPP